MIRTHALAALSALALSVTLAAAPASAQPAPPPFDPAQSAPAQLPQAPVMITRLDPDDAVGLLRDAGYRASVVAQDGNTVEIETRMSGLRVYFTLLGCEAGKQCRATQMRMTADFRFFGLNPEQRSDVEAAVLGTNHWNMVRRYNRSYVYFSNRDRQHIVALESELQFSNGVTADGVRAFVRQYDELAGEFASFVRNGANRRLTNF